jgi:hypothetical protein
MAVVTIAPTAMSPAEAITAADRLPSTVMSRPRLPGVSRSITRIPRASRAMPTAP